MALNYPLQQTRHPHYKESSFDVATAIHKGELILSLSTMLGCDYIFISHTGAHALLENQRLAITLRELLDRLGTSPQQSMLVSAEERETGMPAFTRYDYKWDNNEVTEVIATRVTHSDQADFMQMMFDCSTAC